MVYWLQIYPLFFKTGQSYAKLNADLLVLAQKLITSMLKSCGRCSLLQKYCKTLRMKRYPSISCWLACNTVGHLSYRHKYTYTVWRVSFGIYYLDMIADVYEKNSVRYWLLVVWNRLLIFWYGHSYHYQL